MIKFPKNAGQTKLPFLAVVLLIGPIILQLLYADIFAEKITSSILEVELECRSNVVFLATTRCYDGQEITESLVGPLLSHHNYTASVISNALSPLGLLLEILVIVAIWGAIKRKLAHPKLVS